LVNDVETNDDELVLFESRGTPPLPTSTNEGFVENDGARIWYSAHGAGAPVVLLHGGLGNAQNWSYQVTALTRAGYRAVVVDSRGHGRSTRDDRPFTYERMASDVIVVIDALQIERATLVGWSDGATIALIVAMKEPARVAAVFFFGGNMDVSGVVPIPVPGPLLNRMFARHSKDYARLSPTPLGFASFAAAVGHMMKTEPNYGAADLATLAVPVAIVHSEGDEFITREHAEYLARSIPNAELTVLRDVTHFAPLQRPAYFNDAVLRFLQRPMT
jgi:pimeloyl-ACP methyl ester carboxylesterase